MSVETPRCIRPFALPGDRRHFAGDMTVALRHVRLDLTLDFGRQAVGGTARMTLAPVTDGVETVRLDAREMVVSSVREPGGPEAAFDHRDGVLNVRFPRPVRGGGTIELEIAYEAQPRRGLYFVAGDQAWTQGQANDSRYWFPCLDAPSAKATTELKVTVPAGLYALSNGVLVERSVDAGRGVEVFHWRHDTPHAPYLVSLAVGPFAEIVADRGGVAIRYLVKQDRVADAERAFRRTPEMIEQFGKLLGVPYPYPRYAQVVVDDFIFGGMENTTATTLHRYVLLDERAALDFTGDHLVAHELAHQWFGDLVTCREWSEGWLNEGFATFFETVDEELHHGAEEAAVYRRVQTNQVLDEDGGRYRRAIVERQYREPIDLFDRHLYEKAALVLHMLRRDLGDDGFWRSVRMYLERHRGGAVETTDLIRAIEDTTGRGVRRFFDQWIYSRGVPHLEASWTWDEDGSVGRLTIQQKDLEEGRAPYELDLDVQLGRGGEREKRRLHVSRESETFVLSAPFRPERVVLDPWDDVLMRLEFRPSREMLLAQLCEEPEAPARARAAASLGASQHDARVIEALAHAVEKDAFWGVQAAAAAALGEIRSPAAMAALIARTAAPHPKTRRAIARALGTFREPAAAEALERASQGEPSWFVTAEALHSMGKTRVPQVFDRLVAALALPSYEDVVRIGALDGLGALQDERAIPVVSERTSAPHEPPLRAAAARALGKLGEGRPQVRDRLERMLDDPDFRVRMAATRALGEVGDARAVPALERIIGRDLEGRVVRAAREVSRDLAAGRRWTDELATMRDSMERLRQEMRELRDRVATLDAALEKKAGSP